MPPPVAPHAVLGAILTGGASRRMLGQPKGLLPGPDGAPLAGRAARALEAAGLACVLVGNVALYASLGLPTIDDTRPGLGPLAGLEAALLEARRRGLGAALLVGCDMPYFTPVLLLRLLEARGPAAAFEVDGRFEPLLARYEVGLLPGVTARLDRGDRGLQGLLREEGLALRLEAGEERLLRDWDSPDQIDAGPGLTSC